jgi:hypothetical protein
MRTNVESVRGKRTIVRDSEDQPQLTRRKKRHASDEMGRREGRVVTGPKKDGHRMIHSKRIAYGMVKYHGGQKKRETRITKRQWRTNKLCTRKNETKSDKKKETSAEKLTLHPTMTRNPILMPPERNGTEAMRSPVTLRMTDTMIVIEAEAQHVTTTTQYDLPHTSLVGIIVVNATR